MLKGELFSADMIQAYLEKRKLHTARPIKPHPVCCGTNITFKAHSDDFFLSAEKGWLRCRTCGNDPEYSREGSNASHHYMPKYRLGDFMYARETFCERLGNISKGQWIYKAHKEPQDEIHQYALDMNRWMPSIHMPRSAARLFFRVTKVEVMRLNDVDEQFAREDGFQDEDDWDAEASFRAFWKQTYGPDAIWMWVYWTEPVTKEEAYGTIN